ncbi:helix-turn-helix domain-containing protein [Gymnodinialimonas hymeniacidonis]|uniref:helix-turn-helix domain-containing protein n=1 Tax=Gymnodinialimonas hymeniacidonis TaxID=3126508 RepID=UPI0034C5DC52
MEPTNPPDITGSRIREQRLARGLKQGALAKAVGVSPSYLNLIEHNHRRIGGKLLLELARVLNVEPSVLSEGADAEVSALLDAAARSQVGLGAETDRIDEMGARFPGWTALIAAQEARLQALDAQVEALRDRLSHDPVLAEAMHDVLSSVAAIRSTADILVRETDLDPAWRGRFHRNLHEEAERLSDQATGLLAQFEAPDAEGGSPAETVEAMFDAVGHVFPHIDAQGAGAIEAILDQTPGMENAPTRAMGQARLMEYAGDAALLPMEPFIAAAKEVAFDPVALVARLGVGVAPVLRRMASLQPETGAPPMGLAICDASGAMVHRRRLPGFALPRVVAGCPLWPLYTALSRPGQAEEAEIEMPHGARFSAWAVAEANEGRAFGAAPALKGIMLIMEARQRDRPMPAIAAGPGCETCPRVGCDARRGGYAGP